MKKHPNKEIEAAVDYAIKHGWKIIESNGHPWGQMQCPNNDKDCRCGEFCRSSIWCTPKVPTNHAKQIIRIVDNCKHSQKRKNKATNETEE